MTEQLSDIKLYCPYCGKVAKTLEAHWNCLTKLRHLLPYRNKIDIEFARALDLRNDAIKRKQLKEIKQ